MDAANFLLSTLRSPTVTHVGFFMFTHTNHFKHRTLSVRGGRKDRAVLCTDDRTYELRLAETSNTIILAAAEAPGDAAAVAATGASPAGKRAAGDSADASPGALTIHTAAIRSYYELRRAPPDTARLVHLLRKCAYAGPRDPADAGDAVRVVLFWGVWFWFWFGLCFFCGAAPPTRY
jgi:hypothetical protein